MTSSVRAILIALVLLAAFALGLAVRALTPSTAARSRATTTTSLLLAPVAIAPFVQAHVLP